MKHWRRVLSFAVLFSCANLHAQSASAASTAQRTFHDPVYKLSFDYPANWNFSSRDGEISTFHLDARSAARKTQMRAVVSISRNPFPESTFSGAYLYFSVTPHTNTAACARQARFATGEKPAEGAHGGQSTGESEIAGIGFVHGHDEQTAICVVQRDEIYTTARRGACYRFDLAINTFCGGEVSGFQYITVQQLDQVRARLLSILGTVRFDTK